MKKFLLTIFAILLLVSTGNFGVSAAEMVKFAPPIITLAPQDLGNDELWYIGGNASVPDSEIIILLQNESGGTFSFLARADNQGQWFYAHDNFLKEGKYKAWAQMKIGDAVSSPSPEVAFDILSTAFRIGNIRISYADFYLALALLLLAILAALSAFFAYHFRHYYQKNSRLRKETREAEEEARRGFTLLRQDIREEIDFIGKIKKSRSLNGDERFREEKLFKDLNLIENQIMKEIEDIEPIIS